MIGFLFSPIDYEYSSSDGGFNDSEVPFKGRKLDTIQWLFDRYKNVNNLKDSSLCRKFDIHWWEYWHWHDYFIESRWDIPKCRNIS